MAFKTLIHKEQIIFFTSQFWVLNTLFDWWGLTMSTTWASLPNTVTNWMQLLMSHNCPASCKCIKDTHTHTHEFLHRLFKRIFSPIRPLGCQVEIVVSVIFYSCPEIWVKYWGKHSRVAPHPKCFKLYHIGLWWWTRAKSIRYLHVFYVCLINPRGFGPAVVLKPFAVQPRDKACIVSWRFGGNYKNWIATPWKHSERKGGGGAVPNAVTHRW